MKRLTNNQNELKKKIITLLATKYKIMATEFLGLLPETKGNNSIYMPTLENINSNICWFNMVSQDFCRVFENLLIEEKSICWNPEHIFTYYLYAAPTYKMDSITNAEQLKTNQELWLPISIQLNKENNQFQKNKITKINRKNKRKIKRHLN